jgi:hypothetical protein
VRVERPAFQVILMKMYIPSIGDEIVLTSNWEFGLWNERRNYDFLVFLGDVTKEYWDYFYSNKSMKSRPCVIPKGSLLKIDRIYIRKGVSDYDSITFYWKGLPPKPGSKSKKTRAIRFWVKLEDANKIEFKKASDA